MLTLNDASIQVGQIKQLLHNFNLPNCVVGYKNPGLNKLFICDGYIQRWVYNNDHHLVAQKVERYVYDKPYLNLTTNLPVRNMLYDRETHRYLGRYLRFIRDFRAVNLMSMYNCFDSENFDGDITLSKTQTTTSEDDGLTDDRLIRFKNGYQGYSVFQSPVDFQNLTIRISSGNIAYGCLYITDIESASNTEIALLNQQLAQCTLTKIYANEVTHYDPAALLLQRAGKNSATLQKLLEFIAKNMSKLCFLIRARSGNRLNITILEGTYYLDKTNISKYFLLQPFEETQIPLRVLYPQVEENPPEEYPFALVKSNNSDPLYQILLVKYFIDPVESTLYDNPVNIHESGFFITPQLLATNDTAKQQYLLGDRLAEYLNGNVICPLSNSADIKRMQKALRILHYSDFTTRFDNIHYHYGIWNVLDKYAIRMLIADNIKSFQGVYDMLGYIDKDVERVMGEVLDDVEI